MGRRWGKTVMAGSLSLACASQGAEVAWIVPTYRNARPVWRFAEKHIHPILNKVEVNKTEKTIRFNGGGFGVYTADNPVGILGEAFDLVICEEAARFAPDIWQETIMPTLADRDGRAILISTPKGRNWFWTEYQRGLSDGREQASFTAPSSDNPSLQIRRAYELARTRVSHRVFEQEWNAVFVEDGGGVFRNIRKLSTASPEYPQPLVSYMIGVDWGRTNDDTVFSVWDMGHSTEAFLDRMMDATYATQILRLKALSEKYNQAHIIAESNGLGDPLIEQGQAAGLSITPFYTSNLTKANIIEQLALELERESIHLQSDEIGIGQMEAFESTKTPSGMIKYAAPEGMHDDIVMARAIARLGALSPDAYGEAVYAEQYTIDSSY